MPSGHPGNYTSLTDVTGPDMKVIHSQGLTLYYMDILPQQDDSRGFFGWLRDLLSGIKCFFDSQLGS